MDILKYKTILLQTAKAFIELCDENSLQYVAAFGTVLGAVRHGGLIPWDDDVDVYMPRGDYERFLKMRDKLTGSDYEIIDLQYNKGYYLPYAKFCNRNTSIWETEDYPFTIGVFVDVFPLDDVSELSTSLSLRRNVLKLWKSYSRAWASTALRVYMSKRHYSIRSLISYIYTLLCFSCWRRYYRNRWLSHERNMSYNKKTSIGYIYYLSSSDNECFLKKDIIDNTIEVSFEDFKIKVPEKFDTYLTQMYGDWRKWPQVELRKSNHSQFYVNLEERLSIHEIKHRLKNGEY